jgi:hypothetical protein
MNCFNHTESAASGICKSCGRALCKECMVDVGGSISCSGECEERVKILNEMIESNSQILTTTSNRGVKSSALFSVIMGIVFLSFGIWKFSSNDLFLPMFLSVLGIAFLVRGILTSR